MKHLDLHPSYLERSLPLLGEYRTAFFAANGEEGKGPAWIARIPVADQIVEPIIAAGIGRLIEVEQWTDDQVTTFIRTSSSDQDVIMDEDALVDTLVCTDNAPTFTRYDHDTWIVSYEDGWPVDTWTPEERLQLFKLGMLFSNGDAPQE